PCLAGVACCGGGAPMGRCATEAGTPARAGSSVIGTGTGVIGTGTGVIRAGTGVIGTGTGVIEAVTREFRLQSREFRLGSRESRLVRCRWDAVAASGKCFKAEGGRNGA